MNFIIGLVVTIAGVFITIKTEFMLRSFGRIAFFERHLGPDGGSRLGYKLLGMAVIFIGIIIMTNMIGGFLTWVLSPLLKYNRPQM